MSLTDIRGCPIAALFTVLISLACGGGAGGSTAAPEADALEFAAQPAPQPEPVTSKATAGLGLVLDFPLADGAVQESVDGRVDILYRSAFDPGKQWDAYKAHLESQGWVWRKTKVPPFDGLFVRDGKQVRLSCELAGTSVWVRARSI